MATISRLLLLAVAVAACAWFALGIRQARDTAQATALLTGPAPLSSGQAQRAASLLHAAATLNPDLTVDLLRGRLAADQRDLAAAERIFKSVTRREPQNLDAWLQLGTAAFDAGDRPTLTQAAARIVLLHPKVK